MCVHHNFPHNYKHSESASFHQGTGVSPPSVRPRLHDSICIHTVSHLKQYRTHRISGWKCYRVYIIGVITSGSQLILVWWQNCTYASCCCENVCCEQQSEGNLSTTQAWEFLTWTDRNNRPETIWLLTVFLCGPAALILLQFKYQHCSTCCALNDRGTKFTTIRWASWRISYNRQIVQQ